MQSIGKRHWAIAEGYIPAESVSQDPKLISHDFIARLNRDYLTASFRSALKQEPASVGGGAA